MTYLVGAGAVGDGSAAAAPPVGDAAEARLRGQPLRRALHRQKPEANLAQSKQALATAHKAHHTGDHQFQFTIANQRPSPLTT